MPGVKDTPEILRSIRANKALPYAERTPEMKYSLCYAFYSENPKKLKKTAFAKMNNIPLSTFSEWLAVYDSHKDNSIYFF